MKKRWSFPIYEQRLPERQKKIMTEPEYNFLLIFDGDIWVGELLCWEAEDFIYVEHFPCPKGADAATARRHSPSRRARKDGHSRNRPAE